MQQPTQPIDQALLQRQAAELGLELSPTQQAQFAQYATMLVEWNKKVNLTAITQPQDIVTKHFIDSLLVAKAITLTPNASLIDVGTGAGFPAVPLKILQPNLQITLLDSLKKRLAFLEELCDALQIKATIVHSRAEDAGQSNLRHSFTYATARAVAHLQVLAEYCLPLVKTGGYFIALKGGNCQAELAEANPAIELLGGQLETVKQLTLPTGEARSIILVKKISQTSAKYPRSVANIAKRPLA